MICAQICFLMALRSNQLNFVIPFFYSTLIFVLFYDYLIFKQLPDYLSFIGSLLIMIPKDEHKINLSNFVDFMNTEDYKKNYTYSGRFKIGHKQLCNSIIPPHINIFHSSTLQEDC